MYGKRVSPVDYTSYVQQPVQNYNYLVRNRSKMYYFQQLTDTSPLYSTFSSDGRFPLMESNTPRRKKEVDMRLAPSCRCQDAVSKRQLLLEARRLFMERAAKRNCDTYSPETTGINTLLAMTSKSSEANFGKCGSNCRTLSAPTLAQRIVMNATVGSRRPDSSSTLKSSKFISGGDTNTQGTAQRGVAEEKVLPPPFVCVRRPCLFVRTPPSDRTTRALCSAYRPTAAACPPRKPLTNKGVQKDAHYHDKLLLRLLRRRVTAC